MILHTKLPQFLLAVKQLTNVAKEQLLTDTFLMEREGELAMYYAPHNEYINLSAKIIIVGITPGWSQMKTAFETIIQSLDKEASVHTALKNAKIAASFSGTMRKNLTTMLDEIGLAEALEIPSSTRLFTNERALLHTTSVIKYPVFYKGKNYTGYTPKIDQSTLLKRYAYDIFSSELDNMKHPTLIIPLGKATENVIRVVQPSFLKHMYLFGFPHPSGANGHQKRQLLENKVQLETKIKEWKEIILS